MKKFKELIIWQKSMEVVSQVFELAKLFPPEENYTLRPQIIRSSISIPSNIAEGAGSNSQKEFKRFLEISLGSCYELETQVLIIQRNSIVSEYNFDKLVLLINEIEKMISAFIKKLMSNS